MTRLGWFAMLGIVLAACSIGTFAFRKWVPPHDDLISAPENDAELIQAEHEALRTLPMFWKTLDQAPAYGDNFAVKVRFETDHRGLFDYPWVRNLKRSGGQVTGILDNEPDAMPGQHRGSMVSFPEAHIVDWLIDTDDGQFGDFTTRALLKQNPSQAAQVHIDFSKDPLPSAFKTVPGF